MNDRNKDIKAIQKGYYYQIKLYQHPEAETLYLRSNKIYQIGNSAKYSIEIGDDHIGQIICDKDGTVIIERNQTSKNQIYVNEDKVYNQCLLSHKDIITIANEHFQFFSYFHNQQNNLNCSKLHELLLLKYPQLHNELSLIQRSSFNSYKQYKLSLTSIWKSIEHQSEEKKECCKEMFSTVLSIIKDDDPLTKYQFEKLKLKSNQINTIQSIDDEKEERKRSFNEEKESIESKETYQSKRILN